MQGMTSRSGAEVQHGSCRTMDQTLLPRSPGLEWKEEVCWLEVRSADPAIIALKHQRRSVPSFVVID